GPNVIADKREAGELMGGSRVTGVNAPNGSVHYGLYVRPSQAPFIHALPLVPGAEFAWCVDLPGPNYLPPTMDWWLNRSSAGTIYASSGTLGVVTEVHPGDPPLIGQTLKLERAAATRSWLWTDAEAKEVAMVQGAVLSADQKRLFVADSSSIRAVDVARMKQTGTWTFGTPLLSLATTADGNRVFALGYGGRLLEIDPAGGRLLATVQLDSTEPLQ